MTVLPVVRFDGRYAWLLLVLMFVFGCGSESTSLVPALLAEAALRAGPRLDSPYVIRVCVKQPGVPRHKSFWAVDGAGHLVLEDWELAQYQQNGQPIYYFDEEANPESARMLPIPHNTLQCAEPPPSVLSSNGQASGAKRETQPAVTTTLAQPAATAKPAALPATAQTPPPCMEVTEPGQKRRRGGGTCVRTRTLRAPMQPSPAVAQAKPVQKQSSTLTQAAPTPASPALTDWNVGAGVLGTPILPSVDPQRLMECVGSLCHARHPNFAKNGGKPTASGPLESRALSAGKGGGAKVPQTRKPPTGPEPAAKPAINPTSAPPQTTTTTVVKGKTPSVAPAEARPGKPFRPRDKQQVIDDNRQRNGGETKCENCTVGTVPGQKSQKGITPPRNETQIDHKEPRSKGGSGTADNGQVLCRSCNREKSNK